MWLSIIVLLVFVSVHAAGKGFEDRDATLWYFRLYGLAYTILALQTAIGMRERAEITAEQRAKGRHQLLHMLYWAAVFTICLAEVQFMEWAPGIGNTITATFGLAATGTVLLNVYVRKRARAIASNA